MVDACVCSCRGKLLLTHQAQSSGDRWLTSLMRKHSVCVCVENQLTRQDWVNPRAGDESEGAVDFTLVGGYNASVSRAVSQQDSMRLQSQQVSMCKLLTVSSCFGVLFQSFENPRAKDLLCC